MRLIRLLVALACLAIGVAIGALNAQPVSLDLGITIFSSPSETALRRTRARSRGIMLGWR